MDPLLGCKNPAAWSCAEPSPGYEFGCVAVCMGAIELTCNQEYQGGFCILAPSGETCDVPQAPSGCEICYAAIEQDCGPLIPANP